MPAIEPVYNKPPKLKGERKPADLDRLSEIWFSAPANPQQTSA